MSNMPSELVEKILSLLEDAGIDTETNDAVVALVEAAELQMAEKALRDECHVPALVPGVRPDIPLLVVPTLNEAKRQGLEREWWDLAHALHELRSKLKS